MFISVKSRLDVIPDFLKIVARCLFTVTIEIQSSSASWALVKPFDASRATSISLGLKSAA